MGPQLKGCGRRAMRVYGAWNRVLQWGRSLRAAEGCQAGASDRPDHALQWGRSLRAAEGAQRDSDDHVEPGFNGVAA